VLELSQTKTTSIERGILVDIRDYDKALFYASHLCCQDLIILMVQTKDDLLSKRIENFIISFKHAVNIKDVEKERQSLIEYVTHAVENVPEELSEYAY
jgi:hypothetical protein